MQFLSSILHVGVHCTLPTVSWAVQCVLTLDHLPVSPMSNANHTGRQCSANPAISKLLSHSFTSPHRLHCGRKHRATKNSTRMALTVTVMCHISAARTLHYITASNLSMNTSMRQRLWIGVRDYTGGLLNSRVTERFTRSELHSPLIELFEFLGDSCLKCIVTHLCKQHFYI